MAKNIILFSDGTGNKGGTGSDTNVFKLYHAIKTIKPADAGSSKVVREQICFYDNGVGTSSNSIFQAIGGASGAGFRDNVRDLYEFTCRHYKDDDDIYGFGFSRGAATIRAYAGMVKHCGLVKYGGDEEDFQNRIDMAMWSYVRSGGNTSLVGIVRTIFFLKDQDEDRIENVNIEFLGLWDTVAALGFSQIPPLDNIVNFFRRHKFYNYSPVGIVKNVAHALAVDDERRTFWPLVWNEKEETEITISQVWFPGVHSNVGGGYPRAGLASITLDWMISRLRDHRETSSKSKIDRGLILEKAFVDEVVDGVNYSGKLYDSRGGFALFYRYQPRPITELCSGNCKTVQIHNSVIQRMKLRTAGYSPSQLPRDFSLVYENSEHHKPELQVSLNEPEPTNWGKIRGGIDGAINSRIGLYWSFLSTFLLLIIVSFNFWISDEVYAGYDDTWRGSSFVNGLLGHIADVLNYVLPGFFKNIIDYSVLKHPTNFVVFVGVLGGFYWLRGLFKTRSNSACEKGRAFVVNRVGILEEIANNDVDGGDDNRPIVKKTVQ